jgi:hypothetical protein
MDAVDVDLIPEAAKPADSMNALRVGRALHEWARRHGALASRDAAPSDEYLTLEVLFDTDSESAKRISQALHRLKITAITADDENESVAILCKGAISSATDKKLPKRVRGLNFSYIGKTTIEANPPVIPYSAASGSPLWFTHDGRISCGSSVICSQTFDAGTLGFLGTLRDGRMVGFSNNHVTGESNHTPSGMHILSPSPFDASPSSPPPLAIGTHLELVALSSGDPQQISLQEIDAAIFLITDPNNVTSIQGNGSYDTPPEAIQPTAGMRVKKVGRTTGLRNGTVAGQVVLPLAIPYKSNRFQSIVYFTDVWAVLGEGGNTFSEPGDSGSLVVTLDGSKAVGIVFAGGNNVSYIIPLQKILSHFSITLLSEHNVEVPHEPPASGVGASTQA